eukprot:scaffold588_cov282-Chaetoceros_neogracile.AAC.2
MNFPMNVHYLMRHGFLVFVLLSGTFFSSCSGRSRHDELQDVVKNSKHQVESGSFASSVLSLKKIERYKDDDVPKKERHLTSAEANVSVKVETNEKSPDNYPTEMPTSSKVEKCNDTSGDFKMGSKITTCEKLRFIKDACSREKAAKLCPMTCGTCSKPTNQNDSSPTRAPRLPPNDDTEKNDDEVSEEPECVDSLQTIMIGSKDFSCERVAWQKKKYCTKLGGRVANHCPQTCNKCDKPCTRNDPRPGCPGNDEKDTMSPTSSTPRPSVLTTVKPTSSKVEKCSDTPGDFKMGTHALEKRRLNFVP